VAVCEVCGNDCDKAFEVVSVAERHTFDSSECAIHALAPVCAHCGELAKAPRSTERSAQSGSDEVEPLAAAGRRRTQRR
jgi:hypothetical protein